MYGSQVGQKVGTVAHALSLLAGSIAHASSHVYSSLLGHVDTVLSFYIMRLLMRLLSSISRSIFAYDRSQRRTDGYTHSPLSSSSKLWNELQSPLRASDKPRSLLLAEAPIGRGEEQKSCLSDQVQAGVMLRYNKRLVG